MTLTTFALLISSMVASRFADQYPRWEGEGKREGASVDAFVEPLRQEPAEPEPQSEGPREARRESVRAHECHHVVRRLLWRHQEGHPEFVLVGEAGLYEAWVGALDGDAAAAEVEPHGLAERHDPGLGRAVAHRAGQTPKS